MPNFHGPYGLPGFPDEDTIRPLRALTSPATADLVRLHDASAKADRKITLANLLTVINALSQAQLASLLAAINTLAEDTSPDGTADFLLSYDNSASLAKKVKPTNVVRAGGMQLLTSGTVSAAATLDIVLTSYTAYRAVIVVLSNFVPATDDVDLYCRLSTDGGATYDATGYSFVGTAIRDGSTTAASRVSAAANQIIVAGAAALSEAVSNVAAEGGAQVQVTLHDQTNTAVWPKVRYDSHWYSTDDQTWHNNGSGTRETAQDTDAIRFLFESGNIASGKYAVYGLM